MATLLFLAGLALVAVATGELAGLWWGVLVAGVALVVLGVLTELDTVSKPTQPKPDQPEATR